MATLTPATRITSTEEDGPIHTPTDNELHELTTESVNSASHGFDTKSALEIARIINHEDRPCQRLRW
jgi:N-acetylmuramic acid 6-phosphate etherase